MWWKHNQTLSTYEAYVENLGSPQRKSPSTKLFDGSILSWKNLHVFAHEKRVRTWSFRKTWKCRNTCTYVVKFGQTENPIARMQYMTKISSLCLVKPSIGPLLTHFSLKTLLYLAMCWRPTSKGDLHSFQAVLNMGVRVPMWTQVPNICFISLVVSRVEKSR